MGEPSNLSRLRWLRRCHCPADHKCKNEGKSPAPSWNVDFQFWIIRFGIEPTIPDAMGCSWFPALIPTSTRKAPIRASIRYGNVTLVPELRQRHDTDFQVTREWRLVAREAPDSLPLQFSPLLSSTDVRRRPVRDGLDRAAARHRFRGSRCRSRRAVDATQHFRGAEVPRASLVRRGMRGREFRDVGSWMHIILPTSPGGGGRRVTGPHASDRKTPTRRWQRRSAPA